MQKKKLYILIAVGAALFCAAAVAVSLAVIKANTIRVAFYGVSSRVEDGVKDEIGRMKLGRVKFFELDDGAALPLDFEKKYELLIAKNCLAVKNAAQKFMTVDEDIIEALPISIRKASLLDGRRCALPILLDHFELAYYQPAQRDLGLNPPRSYGGLLRYLQASKKSQEIPLICAGSVDKDLLGFVSAMSEILYGAEDYKKMLSAVKETSSLNKNTLPESLTRVLDEIKAMQGRELLFPKWTKVTHKDIRYFMQERKLAAVAMFLSERRDFEHNLIKYFDSAYFPRYDVQAEHGVIAPQIVAALCSPKKNAALILGQLASGSAQENLTNRSLLAPTAARAEAVDRQADDVRFWAASSAGGALGGIAEECDISSERLRALAQKIRVYLEN